MVLVSNVCYFVSKYSFSYFVHVTVAPAGAAPAAAAAGAAPAAAKVEEKPKVEEVDALDGGMDMFGGGGGGGGDY